MQYKSDDAELFYEIRGQGPDVVLLHPYPSDHTFWTPVAEHLESRFRLVMPDLRGLGQSQAGEGPATMAKIAADVLRLCDALKIGRAVFAGCSVGGYVLFELWRQSRDRVKALMLLDTKAGLDGEEARAGRLKNAEEIMKRGPEWAIEQMMPKLLSPGTLQGRQDVVATVKATMQHSRAEGMAAMQRGMAERRDSLELLGEIGVPVLVLGGEEDSASPVTEMERMAHGIRGAEAKFVAKAGHYAALEQPEEVGRVMREFLERNGR